MILEPLTVRDRHMLRTRLYYGRTRPRANQRDRTVKPHSPDDIPEEAFYFTGGIDEVLARASRAS